MDGELAARRSELEALTKRSPDARVRHRAHGLLALLSCPTKAAASRQVGISVKQLGRWHARFLAEGAAGLGDRPRTGRPSVLPAAARTVLAEALEANPRDDGYPTATWTIADLTHLLGRRGWTVSPSTVTRAVRALGYVHRRPRHDLRHRQDAEAVASAQHTLEVLQKKGLITPAECGCSTLMSVSCTPIPTWQRSGSAAASPAASPPPARTSA